MGGSTVVVQDVVDRLDPKDICAVVERERVNFLQLVGDAFGRPIVEELETGAWDVSSLVIVLSGGAALTTPIKERFLAVLPNAMVIDGLGSSEGGGQGTQVTTAGGPASTGTFLPSRGSCVVAEDLSSVLEPGHEGIGWAAKSGEVPLGYLGDPAKTARTFPLIGGVRHSVPGDRARHLDDGTIELLGRDSVCVNSGGEKIFVEEVEAAVSHHPDVYDVVVCGRPSERWGQEVVAVVQLRDGVQGDPAVEDSLREEAAQHVARFKLPKAWIFVPKVLRSPSGKADYRWAQSQATGS
jgi:acyl-CoA synthetase (AMP-forming)/AMP-acid ligase II